MLVPRPATDGETETVGLHTGFGGSSGLFSGERPIGAAKGKSTTTKASCQPPPPPDDCPSRHNASVHGLLAHCSEKHPLVKAWLESWTHSMALLGWRTLAQDQRAIGRLAIRCSLYRRLRAGLGGSRVARREIGHFRSVVANNVTVALSITPPTPFPSTLHSAPSFPQAAPRGASCPLTPRQPLNWGARRGPRKIRGRRSTGGSRAGRTALAESGAERNRGNHPYRILHMAHRRKSCIKYALANMGPKSKRRS